MNFIFLLYHNNNISLSVASMNITKILPQQNYIIIVIIILSVNLLNTIKAAKQSCVKFC